MTVLRKDEDEWWFARHEDGRTGSIPVPYVQIVSVCVCVCVCVCMYACMCTLRLDHHIFSVGVEVNILTVARLHYTHNHA